MFLHNFIVELHLNEASVLDKKCVVRISLTWRGGGGGGLQPPRSDAVMLLMVPDCNRIATKLVTWGT